MPFAPARACPRGHIIVGGGPCPHCERQRGSSRARGYDEAWASFSKAWLRRFPWCGQRLDGLLHTDDSRCAQAGKRRAAAVTDHIIPLVDGGAHCDETNSQSLCVACNVAKAYRDRRVADRR